MTTTPLAEWLFSEDTSGDTPTSVADSQASPVNLTKTIGSSAGSWTAIAAGAGYDFASAAGNTRWTASCSGNKLQLTSKQKIGCQIVFRHENANAALATLFGVPDAFGGGAPFYIRYTGSGGDIRLYFNDTLVRTFSGLTDGTVYVLTIAVDTTQATANDRIKCWVNTSTAGSVNANPTQNATMTSWNGGTFGIGGHPDGAQFNGAIFYAALHVDGEVDNLVAEATTLATNLLANNDTSPNSAGLALLSRSPADDATNVSASTSTLSLTFNGDIQAGTGNFVLRRASGTPVETIDITDAGQVDITGAVLTFTLTAPLGPGSFYVEIDSTCIEPAGGGDAWAGLSGATAWNFSVQARLARTPIRCTDLNGTGNLTINGTGTTDAVKAGIWAGPLEITGYPGAPCKLLALGEIIAAGSPQPTLSTRIGGRTLQTMAYLDVDGSGPIPVWSALPGDNQERVASLLMPRWDGPGYFAVGHAENNGGGSPERFGIVMASTDYSGTSWSEFATAPIIPRGSGGSSDDFRVADLCGLPERDGTTIRIWYRGMSDADTSALHYASGTAFDALTKSGSNPLTGAVPWSTEGLVPGGVVVDDDGALAMWVSSNDPTDGIGFASSADGINWDVSAAAKLVPITGEQTLGDTVAPIDVGDHVGLIYGFSDAGGDDEGRRLAVVAAERDPSNITKLGKAYPIGGTPYTAITATASGGGVQQYTGSTLLIRFRKFIGDRSAEQATLFQQGDSGSDDHTYVGIDLTAGSLKWFWSTTATATAGPPFDATLNSTVAVDTGEWLVGAFVRVGASELRLYLRDANGRWTLEDTDTSEDFGTFTSAVNIAIGNGHPANTDYGNHPFAGGAIADVIFVSGAPPTGSLEETAAAFEALLDPSRTVYSGGTLQFDESDGTDNGDVVPVEAVRALEQISASTDGSADSSDQTAGRTAFVPASDGKRVGVLCVASHNVTSGPTAFTLNGVAFDLAETEKVSLAGVDVYYMLDADMPATAGMYAWSCTVDGAAGELNAAFVVLRDRAQEAPVITAVATGTGTSLATSIAPTVPGVIVTALYSAGATDEATPSPVADKLCDFSIDATTGPRLAVSTQPVWVGGTFAPSFSDLAGSSQHVAVSVAFPDFGETESTGAIDGALAASASVACTIVGDGALDSGGSATATVAAAVTGTGDLDADGVSSATTSVTLGAVGALAATCSSAATAVTTVTGTGDLACSPSSSAACSANLSADGAIAAPGLASAATLGASFDQGEIEATPTTTAGVTVTVLGDGYLSCAASTGASCGAELEQDTLQAQPSTTATVSASVNGGGALAASMATGAAETVTLLADAYCTAAGSTTAACTTAFDALGALAAALATTAAANPAVTGWGQIAAALSSLAACSAAFDQGMSAALGTTATCAASLLQGVNISAALSSGALIACTFGAPPDPDTKPFVGSFQKEPNRPTIAGWIKES